MTKDPYRYFRIEARELLDQMGSAVLELERGAGDAQTVPRLLRLAHTLKGAARVVRQVAIADHAHAIEDLIGPLREVAGPIPREVVEAMLQRLDGMGTLLAAIDQAPAPAPEAAAANAATNATAKPTTADKPAAELPLSAVRTDMAEMDTLLDGISQVHARAATLRRHQATIERAHELAGLLADQLAMRGRGSAGGHNPAQALADDLRTLIGGIGNGLVDHVDQIDRELRQLRDTAEQLRLVPASAAFSALERTARDAARTLGKQVHFESRGGNVRLDAEVLGTAHAALVQMVRNAVAHGIEPVSDRLAARKPAEGRVTIEVVRRGRRIVFSCVDDGAGFDVEAVRRSAERKGWVGPATQALDTQALMQLLLRGGLSTAATVTEVAGRGIGLDVVRDAVARLGGELGVETAKGQGTTLRLDVPLSIASVEVLQVECAGSIVSIPLDAVRRTLRHPFEDIARTPEGDSIAHQRQAMAYLPLARLLRPGAAPTRAGRFGSAIIVEGAGMLAAIGVDRVVGTAAVVLRPLPAMALADPAIAGASLDVEGHPQLVLDADGLVRSAQRAGAPPPVAESVRKPVLVVDDSLTTRMLEQSILESAGYQVHAAVSAEDGLEQARRQRYALFLVDVEMPGMDGFSFIEHTQADPVLREVPAILVTSRNSPEDLKRGQQVGARGYIVKSEFAQADFLRRVEELVQETS